MSPEDFALMLDMGWTLTDIASHTGIPVKIVELLIVVGAERERIIAKSADAS